MMLPVKPRGLSALGTTSIDALAQSIGRFEGYNVPNSVAQRNNNPGNLRAGTGQIGTDAAGYAIFPDAATGYAALNHQIQLNVDRGLSLDTFFAGDGTYPGYAPAADKNNPAQYAQTVAGWLGIDPTIPLSDVLSGSSGSTSPDLTVGDPTSPLSDGSSTSDGGTSTGLSGATVAILAIGLLAFAYFASR